MNEDIPRSVLWQNGELNLLDQRKLPHVEEYRCCKNIEDVFDARLAHWLRGWKSANYRGVSSRQVLPRLRRVHPGPGSGDHSSQWTSGMCRGVSRCLPSPSRRSGREFRRCRMASAAAVSNNVRLGRHPATIFASRFARIFKTAIERGEGGCFARSWLRRVRRGLCSDRAVGKSTSNSPSRPQHQEVLVACRRFA